MGSVSIVTCCRCGRRYNERDGTKPTAFGLVCGICEPRYVDVDFAKAARSNMHQRDGREDA
jgi:hypothetical protein